MFWAGGKYRHSLMYLVQKPVNVCRIYSSVSSAVPKASKKVLTLTESSMLQDVSLNKVMKILTLYHFQAVQSCIKECSL